MQSIKSIIFTFRNLRLAASLAFGLCLANAALGADLIQSVELSPNPVVTGQNFAIAITASPDVTRATATVTFRTSQSRPVEIPLTQQGQVWSGTGLVPTDIRVQLPAGAGASVRVTLFNAAGRRDDRVVQVGVKVESITAVFEGGVLTVTGDDQDNTILVSRTAGLAFLINGGQVPITGGVPTIDNTSQVRLIGLKGNDVLEVDDNGITPPTTILGNEGDDTLTGGLNSDELDGGPGNDTLVGRTGVDRLLGGPGNDFLSGGRDDDELFGGEDDDVIDWLPGDGSDLVEGEGGDDKLLFVGSAASEKVDISANGPRLRFFRDIGNITMDCDGIEKVTFQALAGADQVNIRDLTDTQVRNVAIDLFGPSGTDDGAADTVTVDGTAASDTITATGSTDGVSITRLNSVVSVVGAEQDKDKVIISALGGDDVIDASAVQAGVNDLTLNGGIGIDTLKGGHGNDRLSGASGNDTAFGGEGDDTFDWNPGDGNDVFEGQAGNDTMLFNGANIGEVITLSANGPRLRFTRNIATVTMDCDDIETVLFTAKGASDSITVNDLSGTDVREVKLDLSADGDAGLGDASPDVVIVNGTETNDVVTVTGSAGVVNVTGLPAAVRIFSSVAADDKLFVKTFAGDDVITATALPAGFIGLIADGGDNNDVLVGSGGDDTLLGGEGDDVLTGGPGLDVLDGGPGANTIIQD